MYNAAMRSYILIVLLGIPAIGLAQTGPSDLAPIPDIGGPSQPGTPSVRPGPSVELGGGNLAITPATRNSPSSIMITPALPTPQGSVQIRPAIPVNPTERR